MSHFLHFNYYSMSLYRAASPSVHMTSGRKKTEITTTGTPIIGWFQLFVTPQTPIGQGHCTNIGTCMYELLLWTVSNLELHSKLFKNKLGLCASSSMNTTDDDDNDDFALMQKQYEQRLADEATAQMVSSDSNPGEELPTPPKSPSAPVTASDGIKSSTSLPPDIPPPSPDLKPQESATSEKPEQQVVSAKEPAVNEDFSDLSEPDEVDELDKEPQPPKSKAKRGRIRKAVVQSPLPAPKKARRTRKKKWMVARLCRSHHALLTSCWPTLYSHFRLAHHCFVICSHQCLRSAVHLFITFAVSSHQHFYIFASKSSLSSFINRCTNTRIQDHSFLTSIFLCCNSLRALQYNQDLLRTGMGSNNLDSKESLRGWVWSNDAMTMKSTLRS